MNIAVSRQQHEQRSRISPTAPWRFVHDPVKLLLRSLCSRCALYTLVAITALLRRLYNLWIAQPRRSWHLSCVSSALMLRSWRLNYAHDDCHCAIADQGIKRPCFHCYRHYLLALKTLQNSPFSYFKMPTHQKRQGKIQARTCAGDYCHPAWTAGRGITSSCLLSSCSPSWARPATSRMSKLEPPVCWQPRTDPEPFGPPPPGLVLIQPGQSLVHNCQLHHSHWNYSVVHLVRRLVVNCCWTWISRRFIQSRFQSAT